MPGTRWYTETKAVMLELRRGKLEMYTEIVNLTKESRRNYNCTLHVSSAIKDRCTQKSQMSYQRPAGRRNNTGVDESSGGW